MTRHEFLVKAGAASAAWLIAPRQTGAQTGPDRLARVSRVIQEYDAQGIHRTATDVDDASARWLLERARSTGAAASLEPFDISRVELRSCSVRAGGRTIEGLPLFDGGLTGAAGVAGRLGPADSDAEIAVVELNAAAITSEGRSLEAARRAGRHRAVVGITRGAHPGLTPMNAARFAAPYGPPVVQIASQEGDWLQDLARRGEPATVVADAARVPDTAANVAASVRGTKPDLPPVVVITPRSGWWHCAAERGGGLACWLETMAAAAAARPARTIEFVASSGHELGHLGLDAFIHRRHGLVKEAAGWIHLGANIGAAGGRMRLQASDDQMEARAAEALAQAGASVPDRVPRGTVPGGEARNIHAGGGRYVSLLGNSPFFHSIADRWPDAVDAAAVARAAGAVADLAIALAR